MSELKQCQGKDCGAYIDGGEFCSNKCRHSVPSRVLGSDLIILNDCAKRVTQSAGGAEKNSNPNSERALQSRRAAEQEPCSNCEQLRAENERLKTACGGAEQFLGCITWNEDWTEVEGSDILQQLRNAIGDTK